MYLLAFAAFQLPLACCSTATARAAWCRAPLLRGGRGIGLRVAHDLGTLSLGRALIARRVAA